MVLGISCAKIQDQIFDVQDPKKIAAISLIPYVGMAWGLLRQRDITARANKSAEDDSQKTASRVPPPIAFRNENDAVTSTTEAFEWVKKKNQVKKICACGGLIQTIAYLVCAVALGVPLLQACKATFVAVTFGMSCAFYITAKMNEYTIRSPKDLGFFYTKVW